MKTCIDFINLLDHDMSLKVLMCLDDPSDLVRISLVSCSWQRFVISNGICKQLCLRKFPQLLSSVMHVSELGSHAQRPFDIGSSSAVEWENMKREHTVYACIGRDISSIHSCISTAISASSTDRYPDENIFNTLEPRSMVGYQKSYWSSEGKRDPASVNTLVYKLVSSLCVITEINIRPFQDYYDLGCPIYPAKSVRFKMGHCTSVDEENDDHSGAVGQNYADDKFVWTYISPEFPMAQENKLQVFRLPEPVLCIGGMLQIELLGHVQRHTNELFYTCITFVQAMGRNLSPTFRVKILEPCGNFVLQYYPRGIDNQLPIYTDKANQAVSAETISHSLTQQHERIVHSELVNFLFHLFKESLEMRHVN